MPKPKTAVAVPVQDLNTEWKQATKPQWEKDIEAFKASNPTVLQIVERYPCLSRFASLMQSMLKHGGQFCHLETVKLSKSVNNETKKFTTHTNLAANVNYYNKERVQMFHATGKRAKSGKLSGRKKINKFLGVRCCDLEQNTITADSFTVGFGLNANYKSVSKYYSGEGEEVTRDKAIEIGGCAFARSKSPYNERDWFTSKIENILDFRPMD